MPPKKATSRRMSIRIKTQSVTPDKLPHALAQRSSDVLHRASAAHQAPSACNAGTALDAPTVLLRCQRRGRNTAWPSMPPARWKSAGPGPHTQRGSGIGTGRGLDELPSRVPTAYRPHCLAQAGGTQPDKGGEPPRTACRPRCRAQAGARMGLHAHQGKSGVELSISHGMRRTSFCSQGALREAWRSAPRGPQQIGTAHGMHRGGGGPGDDQPLAVTRSAMTGLPSPPADCAPRPSHQAATRVTETCTSQSRHCPAHILAVALRGVASLLPLRARSPGRDARPPPALRVRRLPARPRLPAARSRIGGAA